MSEIRCYPIDEDLAQTRPWAARYACLHGKWALMSEKWNEANLGKYKSTEEVYKDCLRKGVTWQELLNFKPDYKKTL